MSSESGQSSLHLIIVPFEAWGHVRALCALVPRLVQSKPTTVTFFTTLAMYDRIDVELARNFEDTNSTLRDHIRLVALKSDGGNPLDIRVFAAAFAEAYKKLANEEPIACLKTGSILNSVPAPDAALLDMFASPLLAPIRASSNKPVKAFCWTPCAAYATYSLIHIVSQGSDEGTLQKLEQLARETGQSVEDVATEIFDGVRGVAGKVPGLPMMYDHEKYPQQMIIDMSLGGEFHLAAVGFLDQCDGVVTSSPACFEPTEALSGLKRWLANTSRTVYSVGPLLPLKDPGHAAEYEKKLSQDAAAIDTFLDSVMRSHGPKSTLFISFGSFFWSTEPAKIWAFLDVLLEKNIPFIFSHGSPFAVVPEDVLAKVKASGLGLLTRWAPQQSILAHPAVGWFVTHCGFNSVIESVVAGVPMICWPYQAEQPLNAAHLTDNLGIAYKLVEVRTGEHGLKPVYRTEQKPIGTVEAVKEEARSVLERAFGEDGDDKRTKIMKLRETVRSAWDENGPSRQAMESLRDAWHTAI